MLLSESVEENLANASEVIKRLREVGELMSSELDMQCCQIDRLDKKMDVSECKLEKKKPLGVEVETSEVRTPYYYGPQTSVSYEVGRPCIGMVLYLQLTCDHDLFF